MRILSHEQNRYALGVAVCSVVAIEAAFSVYIVPHISVSAALAQYVLAAATFWFLYKAVCTDPGLYDTTPEKQVRYVQ